MVNDWENEGGAIRGHDDEINVIPDPSLYEYKEKPGAIEKFIMDDVFGYRTFLFIIVVQLWVIIFRLYGVF